MRRFTKIFYLQIALVLAVVFLLASFAQASGNHHSHHQIVSPFDKINADKPLHCLLNAHLHQIKQDCPHQKSHSKSAKFRADCGSHRGASHQKGFSFGSDLSQLSQDEFIHRLASYPLYPLRDYKVRILPHSIEHPPQLS